MLYPLSYTSVFKEIALDKNEHRHEKRVVRKDARENANPAAYMVIDNHYYGQSLKPLKGLVTRAANMRSIAPSI